MFVHFRILFSASYPYRVAFGSGLLGQLHRQNKICALIDFEAKVLASKKKYRLQYKCACSKNHTAVARMNGTKTHNTRCAQMCREFAKRNRFRASRTVWKPILEPNGFRDSESWRWRQRPARLSATTAGQGRVLALCQTLPLLISHSPVWDWGNDGRILAEGFIINSADRSQQRRQTSQPAV